MNVLQRAIIEALMSRYGAARAQYTYPRAGYVSRKVRSRGTGRGLAKRRERERAEAAMASQRAHEHAWRNGHGNCDKPLWLHSNSRPWV